MNLLLQPAASDSKGRCNFYRTIENRVSQRVLAQSLRPGDLTSLASETSGKAPCAWGLRDDSAGRNQQTFDRLESGDLVLFGGVKCAIAWGNVAWKAESPGLAVRLWDDPDHPLRFIYFLAPVGFFDSPVPRSEINKCAGLEPDRVWAGASFVAPESTIPVIELLRIHGFPKIAA